MGLDLTSASHTIGLEDIKHLFTQCELLEGQKWGIPWNDVCNWYLKCSEVQNVRRAMLMTLRGTVGRYQQNLNGSFLAVSKPIFVTK